MRRLGWEPQGGEWKAAAKGEVSIREHFGVAIASDGSATAAHGELGNINMSQNQLGELILIIELYMPEAHLAPANRHQDGRHLRSFIFFFK